MQRKTIATLTLLALLLLATPLLAHTSYSTTAATISTPYADLNDLNMTEGSIIEAISVAAPFTFTLTNNLTNSENFAMRIGFTNETGEHFAYLTISPTNSTFTYSGNQEANGTSISNEDLTYTAHIYASATTTHLHAWSDSATVDEYNITGQSWTFDTISYEFNDPLTANFTAGTFIITVTGIATGFALDYTLITGMLTTILLLSVVMGIFAKKRGR